MKKVFPFLLTLVMIGLFALTACTPAPSAIATSQAVQLPIELKLAINALVLFGVTFGLQWVFEVAKLDLRGIGAALAVGVSEFLILQLQGLIDVVPAEYDIYVMIGLNVLLAVLTTLGYIRVAFQRSRAAAMFTVNPRFPVK
ncbi:MAG: hypothetical protein EHM33_02020 [Chloroflexi bacterium]|nr:MAG: hypothetical protein EHM33_02020 [Chloroflexota bacterium]